MLITVYHCIYPGIALKFHPKIMMISSNEGDPQVTMGANTNSWPNDIHNMSCQKKKWREDHK